MGAAFDHQLKYKYLDLTMALDEKSEDAMGIQVTIDVILIILQGL